MIRAPCSTAQMIPVAIRSALTEPPAVTRTGMIRQRQQCPAMPIPLLPRAAITLATRVPWLCVSWATASFSTKSQPGTRASCSSGIAFTPVSIVAITTFSSPVVVSHTCGSPICLCAH